MSLAANLRDVATELCKYHPHGGWVLEPLIKQLRDAIGASYGRGNGGGSGAPLPLDAGALDLYNEICADVRAGADVEVTIYKNAMDWAKLEGTDREGEALTVYRTLNSWALRIKQLSDPVRHTEITSPCPACDQRWHYVTMDGQRQRVGALQAVHSSVTCLACDTAWHGKELHNLKEAIDAETPAKPLADPCHMA